MSFLDRLFKPAPAPSKKYISLFPGSFRKESRTIQNKKIISLSSQVYPLNDPEFYAHDIHRLYLHTPLTEDVYTLLKTATIKNLCICDKILVSDLRDLHVTAVSINNVSLPADLRLPDNVSIDSLPDVYIHLPSPASKTKTYFTKFKVSAEILKFLDAPNAKKLPFSEVLFQTTLSMPIFLN